MTDRKEDVGRITEPRARLKEAEQDLRAMRDRGVHAPGKVETESSLSSVPVTERLCCAVVESMSEAAVVVGDDGTIVYENGRFAEMLRMPPD
jgi:PAS domain-containing protein